MSLFRVEELLPLLRCQPTDPAQPVTGTVSSVAIDSRKVAPGALFVPLSGERTDGHDHIGSAITAGAGAVLVAEREWARRREALQQLTAGRSVPFLLVRDPLMAMQQLAAHHLTEIGGVCRIGITGSNGKTTTKEIIGSILRGHAATYINQGNFNSEIGLPLSVFEIRREHRFAVLEMGMNYAGEMDILSDILRPDLALITNIGTAHIGPLGSMEAIAAEKKKVFKHFNGSQQGFLPEDERYFEFLSRDVRGGIVRYGQRTTRGFQGYRSLGLDGTTIYWEGLQISFPLIGLYNLQNALGAITLCRALGLAPGEIRRGLEAVQPLFGRSQIVKGAQTVIQDCYNANPESMQTALSFLAGLDWPGRKIAVLGSMRELGADSEAAHTRLGKLVAAMPLDAVFFFGEETDVSLEAAAAGQVHGAGQAAAARQAEGAGQAAVAGQVHGAGQAAAARQAEGAGQAADGPGAYLFQTADFDCLKDELTAFLREGDLVLLKGSRGVELERLSEFIKG